MHRNHLTTFTCFLLATTEPLMAQTTAPAPGQAPARAPATAPVATAPVDHNWWWIIPLILILGAVIWYFMNNRETDVTTTTTTRSTVDDTPLGVDRDRIAGAAKQAKGSLEVGAGKVLGDAKLQAEGERDRATGKIQNTVGGLKDTLRE